MAWIRQLPSGVWAATVYTPAGRRTESDPLRGVIEDWAGDLESSIRRGEFLDPQLARKTVGQAWEQFEPSRRIEMASRKRDRSHWRVWVEPRWGKVQCGAVLKPDVQTWVNELEEDKVGGWTIIAALNVLKAAMELAVDAGWIRANPARRVRPPMPPKHDDRVILPHEETMILDRLDELFPERRDARLFVEGMLETGARWEEVAAVRREAVNLRHGLIDIGPVMERDGTIRDYPKGARSRHDVAFRAAPIGDAYLARLKPVVLATKPGGLIYTAPKGGPMLYPTWLRRLWNVALRVPIVDGDGKPTGEWEPLIDLPLPTPHDCRHTYGTRLADAGMAPHDRMALMGHKDLRSAQRYTHSGETRFDAARQALKRARSS
ncbi:tyrosine-type recombinase/integrase [Plantactinospora sp. WMMB334]|uniref:tyrosine-type recombinase/integrase n=1 Tax=Plantactinospora sp. WMMB334 TaxID=3404119 RepID=UPI003B928E5C